ncbi:MAG: hypothetical protein SCARUB_04568, partial [Candidatus Scalindua rubra]
MEDTSIEKKLKHDIHQKNTIRREIERRIRTVCQWKDKLANFKSFQKQKKLILASNQADYLFL